jgi:hypothetical protein
MKHTTCRSNKDASTLVPGDTVRWSEGCALVINVFLFIWRNNEYTTKLILFLDRTCQIEVVYIPTHGQLQVIRPVVRGCNDNNMYGMIY